MKYKGINLVQASDREDQLLCGVEFNNPKANDDLSEEMEENLVSLFKKFPHEMYIEQVLDDFICVSCYDITFDEGGVKLLKKIYDILFNSGLVIIVTVNVHVDEEWFKREDKTEYNEDMVSWEEFVKYLEY